MVGPSDAADVVVLNTCTVTATADAKARQFLRAARRRNPGAVVVATGCYAQRAPGDLERLPQVSLVVGNTGKSSLVETVESIHSALEADVHADSEPIPLQKRKERPDALEKAVGRTRAMVKIQEGCDQICAYCIVPKVRGRERSIAPEEIIAEINRHVSEGCREVALTGTQLGTYGFDILGESLRSLLERILAETRVERLRVSSLQAHEITGALLELWQGPAADAPLPCPVTKRQRFGSQGHASTLRHKSILVVSGIDKGNVPRCRDNHGHHCWLPRGDGPGLRGCLGLRGRDEVFPTSIHSRIPRGLGLRRCISGIRFQTWKKRERMGKNAGPVCGVPSALPGRADRQGTAGPMGKEFVRSGDVVRTDRQLPQSAHCQWPAPFQQDHRRTTGGTER